MKRTLFSTTWQVWLKSLSQGVFFFLPSCEPRQGRQDFLGNFLEVWSLRRQKMYQNVPICLNSCTKWAKQLKFVEDFEIFFDISCESIHFLWTKFTGSRGKIQPAYDHHFLCQNHIILSKCDNPYYNLTKSLLKLSFTQKWPVMSTIHWLSSGRLLPREPVNFVHRK